MRWRTGRRSDNVEDYRGSGSGMSGGGYGGSGLSTGHRVVAGGGLGLLLLLVLGMVFGVDPRLTLGLGNLLGLTTPGEAASSMSGAPATVGVNPGGLSQGRQDELADFVSVVLADTEDTWKTIFADSGVRYQEPKLVLFSNYIQSACGLSEAAMGPFYCPADQKVYIDLSFYDELQNRFHAPGDFAQAYVVAHEIGHHVQNLLGISDQVSGAQRRAGKAQSNRLSVMLELQADCLAGVWAHHAQAARNILEQGDIEEGLNAAAQIGDDRMQRRSMGFAVPDSFTHGSAEQRVRWFREGLRTGDFQACNTFEAASL